MRVFPSSQQFTLEVETKEIHTLIGNAREKRLRGFAMQETKGLVRLVETRMCIIHNRNWYALLENELELF